MSVFIQQTRRLLRTHMLRGLVGGLLLASGGSGVAHAQSSYDYNRASTGTSDTYMETRVSDLETQLRSMNGRIEQVEWQNKQLQTRLNKLQADLELRLGALEQSNRPQAAYEPTATLTTPTATPPRPRSGGAQDGDDDPINRLAQGGEEPGESVNGRLGNLYVADGKVKGADQKAVKPVLPKPPEDFGLTPQEQYDEAFAQLRNADYDKAEISFKSFIKKNPKDKLAENAKYWLGESHYVRAQYDAAAVAFADAYQSAPKGSKAPDSLMKLGLALAGLKKTEDACTTLGEVVRRYPNASTTVKSRTSQEMKKLKCPS